MRGLFVVVCIALVSACGLAPDSELSSASSSAGVKLFSFQATPQALTGLVSNISKVTPIKESVNGASFNGSATTSGLIKIDPLESGSNARLLVYIDLDTVGNYAISSKVPLRGTQKVANGTTKLTGVISSEITLDVNGFKSSEPQYTQGVTSTNFRVNYSGITRVGTNKVRDAAREKLGSNKGRVNSTFEQEVYNVAMQTMRDQMATFNAEANGVFSYIYGYLFEKHDLPGASPAFYSDGSKAYWDILVSDPKYVNGITLLNRPMADMSFTLHENLLNSLIAENMVMDEYITPAYFQNVFAGMPLALAHKVPQAGAKQEYPKMKFERANPIKFRFVNNTLVLTARAHIQFSAEQSPTYYDLKLVYDLSHNGSKANLVRSSLEVKNLKQPHVAVKSSSKSSKPGIYGVGGFFEDVAGGLVNFNDSSMIEGVLSSIFAEQVEVGSTIRLNEKKSDVLVLKDFGTEHGWLLVNWQVAKMQ